MGGEVNYGASRVEAEVTVKAAWKSGTLIIGKRAWT